MFGRKKHEKEIAQIIAGAAEKLGRAIETAERFKSKDGLLNTRMLAYFDQWIAHSPASLNRRLSELRSEKDIFEVLRKLLALFVELSKDADKR